MFLDEKCLVVTQSSMPWCVCMCLVKQRNLVSYFRWQIQRPEFNKQMVLNDSNPIPELIKHREQYVNKEFSRYGSCSCSRAATLSPSILGLHLSSLVLLLIPLLHWFPCLDLSIWNNNLSHLLFNDHSLCQAHTYPDILLALSLSFLESLFVGLTQTFSTNNTSYHYLLTPGFDFFHSTCHILSYCIVFLFAYHFSPSLDCERFVFQ